MFVDTRQLDDGAVVQTTVCIVGGGVAGITLALELERRGIDACVLESGGTEPDERTRDLCRGENVGLPYEFADGHRHRYLGGNSNGWGGWSSPWDPWDFEERSWVPHSGWPFGLEELEQYWDRTHEMLQIGPSSFDTEFWLKAMNRPDVHRMPLVTGNVVDGITQSRPTRFRKSYVDELGRARRVRVFLHANVTNIECDRAGSRIDRVEVKTLSGRAAEVVAAQFVLATGGIENARLLLASNDVRPAGLGNGYDLVGRYFMDNPRLWRHRIHFGHKKRSNPLYDTRSYRLGRTLFNAHETDVISHFALSRKAQEHEQLLNSRIWFATAFRGEGTDAAQALQRWAFSVYSQRKMDWSILKDIPTLLANPVDTLAYASTRFVRPRQLIKYTHMYMVIEQSPNPDSRVSLSSERDQLGINRVKVDWRLNELDARTFNRGFELLAEELRDSGTAEVEFDDDGVVDHHDWPEIKGTWHHMGTTRMHDSPKHGVVDRDCRVHELSNLYVAGSSVFPTAGPNYPTRLIVALTLRLAAHLETIVSKDSSTSVTSARSGKSHAEDIDRVAAYGFTANRTRTAN